MEEKLDVQPEASSLPVKKEKSLTANQKHALKKRDIQAVVNKIVGKVDKKALVKEVSEITKLDSDQALDYIIENKIATEVHDQLVESVTSGAIAAAAIGKLNQLIEKGNMEALKLVLGFNKTLQPQITKQINNLTLQKNDINVFQAMHERASKLIGD